MSKKIEAVGTYRGELIETAFKFAKSGNPMFVAKFRADERYLEDAADLALFLEHGIITEAVPQWVDWTEYDETLYTFMVLFTLKTPDESFIADETDPECNASGNYRQLQTALGWDGTSFEELASGKFNGKKVLARVKEEEDPKFGPTTIGWLDEFDAPPQRELKGMDISEATDLNKRLKGVKKKASPVAAAAKAKAKPVVTKPKTSVAPKPKAGASADNVNVDTATEVAGPTPTAPAPTAAATPETAEVFNKDSAWNDVYTRASANGNTPDVITDCWIAAVSEVAEAFGGDESKLTDKDWTKIRKIALKDLS